MAQLRKKPLMNSRKNLKRTCQDVLNMLDILEDDMYEEITVDCMGNPIKE